MSGRWLSIHSCVKQSAHQLSADPGKVTDFKKMKLTRDRLPFLSSRNRLWWLTCQTLQIRVCAAGGIFRNLRQLWEGGRESSVVLRVSDKPCNLLKAPPDLSWVGWGAPSPPHTHTPKLVVQACRKHATLSCPWPLLTALGCRPHFRMRRCWDSGSFTFA